ncbi:MAG: hypothetical protein L3J04_10180 [Robiginitomaculum sp.]|nr:hypothetical protein [Robiginitomaculum sp.]
MFAQAGAMVVILALLAFLISIRCAELVSASDLFYFTAKWKIFNDAICNNFVIIFSRLDFAKKVIFKIQFNLSFSIKL